MWACTWPRHEALSLARVQGGMVALSRMVVVGGGCGMAVVVGRKKDVDTDENISPVENPIFAILTKIHL